jgi:hypothetical protein
MPECSGPDCLRSALIDGTLRWAQERSAFYAARFGCLSFSQPWDLQSLPLVPITKREDVREAAEVMLCRGLRVSHLQNTSGTSGEPLLLYRSIEETRFIREFFAEVHGGYAKDEFPLILNLRVPHHGTGTPVPARVCVLESGVTDEELLEHTLLVLRKAFQVPGLAGRVSAISGSHSQVLALTNHCIEQGFESTAFTIRYIHLTGQYLTSRWRQLLEQYWNATVVDRYSLSEIFGGATRCGMCEGFHFDPLVIPELVSIGDHTPIHEGVGMLLLTTLYPFVQMQPLIRYWTGDVFERIVGQCPAPSFYFKGRESQCLFDPFDVSRILIAATDLIESIDEYPEVRRPPQFLDMPSTAYREATGRPIFAPSYSLDGPLLRCRIEVEFTFTPSLYRIRVGEILVAIRRSVLARSRAFAEAIASGRAALDLIAVGPGSLKPVVKNSRLWKRLQ